MKMAARRFRYLLVVALLLLVAPPIAKAQETRPSFDCAKAVTAIDKMICADPKLAEADRALADSYTRLQRELSPDSFATVRVVERAWLLKRAACAPGHVIDGEKLSAEGARQCLANAYEQQGYLIDIPVKNIGSVTLEGRLRVKTWQHPKTDESDRYPWLIGTPAATTTAFNQAIAAELRLERHPFAAAGFDNEPDLSCDFDRSYALHHADERLISLQIEIHHECNIGHGWREESAFNWDLAHNRPLDFAGLFADGDWRAAITQFAIKYLEGEVGDPAGFVADFPIDDPQAWVFDDDGAVLRLGHGERSGAGASADVEIPYDVLAPLLRPDAPLPLGDGAPGVPDDKPR
jgi:uncharacterized protein YecT (DUF1311 family)